MFCIKKTKIFISSEVEVVIKGSIVFAKGSYGTMALSIPDLLNCERVGNEFVLSSRSIIKRRFIGGNKSLLGTVSSLLRSMLIGVSVGFIKKLQLVGVGYRVVLDKKNIIVLSVGFSHVINYKCPDNVNVSCPTSVDIVLSSANKQLVGQVAADLRFVRPPEPFSGKGIRYEDEELHIKEVKKK